MMHIFAALLYSAIFTTVAALGASSNRSISTALFADLEEAARLADIAYCVGVSGIWAPFGCLSRCSDFPDFELVDTWNTGPLLSDSCGYIALDHPKKRIVVSFRGTYSLAGALADLSTIPQEFLPYPEPPPPSASPPRRGWFDWLPWRGRGGPQNILALGGDGARRPECMNCTVHAGFFASWLHTRPVVLPHLSQLVVLYPDYEIRLIGHSLGGAVAALAGLELRVQGAPVVVTTFGEPRIGNDGLVRFIDEVFELRQDGENFRRVTHVGDPVPLLPLEEWGYRMHAGEIYISKTGLPVGVRDMERCVGDEDSRCIAGADESTQGKQVSTAFAAVYGEPLWDDGDGVKALGGEEDMKTAKSRLASRFRIWQLLFAHRDYFWRIGLCVPGGDPAGWWKGKDWYGRNEGKEDDIGETIGGEEL